MIYRFTEVLNDLVNYFLLGDILLLEDWKQANHLSDDLGIGVQGVQTRLKRNVRFESK